jgi:hypothetical protein
MQYKFTERYEYVKTVEFQNSIGIQDIDKLSYFVEEDLTGIFISKEFRYSFDNTIWSNWNTLTQLNLTNVNINNNTNFYLHVKYTRAAINTGNIQNFYLFYESSTITPPLI